MLVVIGGGVVYVDIPPTGSFLNSVRVCRYPSTTRMMFILDSDWIRFRLFWLFWLMASCVGWAQMAAAQCSIRTAAAAGGVIPSGT